MNKFGIHAPNGMLDNDAMFSMGVSHYIMLHLQAELYAYRARQVSKDGIIEIRFYLSNWGNTDPIIWAQTCAREYTQLRQYDGTTYSYESLGCHVTPANEQNLALEGGGWTQDWYRKINTWNLTWLREFQRITNCPIERIHFPAFAYGHSDDQNDLGYIGMELCREAIEAYGVLDVHPYWFDQSQVEDEFYGHRFELAHKLFQDKQIFCSELGNFNVMRSSTPDEFIQWFNSLPEYVIGGTPFIWEDPTKAHRANDWSRNPQIAERIAACYKKERIMPFEFAFGFKTLHDKEPEIIGEATSPQYDVPGVVSFQFTTHGILLWDEKLGVRFMEQTLPFAWAR